MQKVCQNWNYILENENPKIEYRQKISNRAHLITQENLFNSKISPFRMQKKTSRKIAQKQIQHDQLVEPPKLQRSCTAQRSEKQHLDLLLPAHPIFELLRHRPEGRLTLYEFEPSHLGNYSWSYTFPTYGNLDSYLKQGSNAERNTRELESLEFYRGGNMFKQAKNYALAIQLYEEAIRLNPSLYEAQNNLATIYYCLQLQEESKSVLLEAIGKAPRNQLLINNLGLLYLKQDHLLAIRNFQLSKSIRMNQHACNNLGYLYLQIGQELQAVSEFQQALSITHNQISYTGLAIASTLLGRFEEALRYFNEIEMTDFNRKNLLINKGNCYYEAKRNDEAFSCFAQGVQLYPDEPHFYNGLGLVNFSEGKLLESQQWFRKAADTSSRGEFHSNYICFLARVGRTPEALAYLKQLLARDDIDGQINILEIVKNLKAHVDATTLLHLIDESLAKQSKLKYKVLNLKSCILASTTAIQASWQVLLQASCQQPSPRIMFNLGCILYQMKKVDQSIPFFQQAIRLDQAFAESYYYLGAILLETKKYEQAIVFLDKFLQMQPQSYQGYNTLGVAHYFLKDYQNSLSFIQRSLSIQQKYPFALNNQALFLWRSSKLVNLDYFFENVTLWTNPQIILNKANVLLQRGKYTRAKRLYEIALDVQSNFTEAHHNLGYLLLSNNDLEKGFSHLKRAALLDPQAYQVYMTLAYFIKINGIERKAIKLVEIIKRNNSSRLKVLLNLAVLLKIITIEQEYLKYFHQALEAIVQKPVEPTTVEINLEAIKHIQSLHQHLNKAYPNHEFKDLLLAMALLSDRISSKQASRQYLAKYLSLLAGESSTQGLLKLGLCQIEKFSPKLQQLFASMMAEYGLRVLMMQSPAILQQIQQLMPNILISEALMSRMDEHPNQESFQRPQGNYQSSEQRLNEPQSAENPSFEGQDQMGNECVVFQARYWFGDLGMQKPSIKYLSHMNQKRHPSQPEQLFEESRCLHPISQRQAKGNLELAQPPSEVKVDLHSWKQYLLTQLPPQGQPQTHIFSMFLYYNQLWTIQELASIQTNKFARFSTLGSFKEYHPSFNHIATFSEFIYYTQPFPQDHTNCFEKTLAQKVKYLQRRDIYQLFKGFADMIRELERHRLHHPSIISSLHTDDTGLICSSFQTAHKIRPSQIPQFSNDSYFMTRSIIAFWLTIRDDGQCSQAIKQILKGLPEDQMKEVLHLRELVLNHHNQRIPQFKAILEEIINYAETAMKIDHLNQLKEFVSRVVSLSVQSGHFRVHQVLTIEDSSCISDIVSKLNAQEDIYGYFLKELEKCKLNAKSSQNETSLNSFSTAPL